MVGCFGGGFGGGFGRGFGGGFYAAAAAAAELAPHWQTCWFIVFLFSCTAMAALDAAAAAAEVQPWQPKSLAQAVVQTMTLQNISGCCPDLEGTIRHVGRSQDIRNFFSAGRCDKNLK